MKVVIAAGGTGGHIFPAQVLAEEIKKHNSNSTITFMAHGLSSNSRFSKTHFESIDIQAPKMPNSIFSWPKFIWKMMLGTMQAIRALMKIHPDVIVGFGSYHTVPVLIAGWIFSIPIILHESNSIPGRVNRLFSRVAHTTAIFFPQASRMLQGESILVKMPLRSGFSDEKKISREEVLKHYNLSPSKKTVLIFGGSQGAVSLNELAVSSISLVSNHIPIQVLHFTGSIESAYEIQRRYSDLGISAVVKDFEHHMALAWRSADCAVIRAGAATIAEQLSIGVPAIFIPYPHAQDNHQYHNALFVEGSIGGARCFEEKSCDHRMLARALEDMLDESNLDLLKNNITKANWSCEEPTLSEVVLRAIKERQIR